MDQQAFEELSARLRVASELIAELEPTLRDDAWNLIRPYVAGEATSESHEVHEDGSERRKKSKKEGVEEDVLIEEHESDKESDNLYLTLAILYQRHGRAVFTMDLIKATGKELDLVLPNRPDTTFRNSTKKIVRKQDGGYKIQPGGETWLKDTYKVKKGKLPLPGNS